MKGRLAPSPTGAMHLGNARTALLAWLQVRAAGGTLVMRVEDLDTQRVVAGAEAKILEELRWLGLDWDEGPDVGGPNGPYRQSMRSARYTEAVRRLLAEGKAFECACSRAEIARASSAPHAGEEAPRYPGTCRDLVPGEAAARARGLGRAPAVRFRGGAHFAFRDLARGEVDPLPDGVDDFVIQRVDGIAAYQLAVVVDDAAQGITHVLRADDLLDSTPRQLALYDALGLSAPAFAHVPLVLAPGGERLAKRNRPASVAELRAAGIPSEEIVGLLAASAGLAPEGARLAPRALLAGFDLARIVRAPAEMDPRALLSGLPSAAAGVPGATVRAVEGADAIALAEIYVASWQEAYRGILPDAVLDALSVRTQTARWQKMLAGMAKSETRAWLVEEGGRARGFVVTGPVRGETSAERRGEVWAMYLEPASWRRGLGRVLLGHAEDDLRGRGYSEVVLWVLSRNERARAFYAACGYEARGETRANRIGEALVEEMRMARPLEAPGA